MSCLLVYYTVFLCIFCRGKGPLKTTMDVINAAKKIADAGSKLDKLARDIADKVRYINIIMMMLETESSLSLLTSLVSAG